MTTPSLVYNNARYQFGTGAWDWPTLPVYAALVTAGYAPNAASDVNLSDIPSEAIVIDDVELTSLAITAAGITQGVIPQFSALSAGSPIVALVLYVKGGSDATSPLIYYSGGVGFPFTAGGANYDLAYDQLNGGFFQV